MADTSSKGEASTENQTTDSAQCRAPSEVEAETVGTGNAELSAGGKAVVLKATPPPKDISVRIDLKLEAQRKRTRDLNQALRSLG